MQKNFKKGPLVVSVVALLVAGAVFLFFFRDIRNNILAIKQDEENLQKETAKMEEVKNLNNYFKSIQTEKALFETHFVQSSDIVPFLNSLEEMATRTGSKAEVQSINLENDRKDLMVGIKDTGTFSQVYKFLLLLENSPYELEFTSVELGKKTGTDESGKEKRSDQWEVLIKMKLVSFT